MHNKRSRLRQLWSETRWIQLAILWLAGLILGYAGFAQFSKANVAGWSAGDIFYLTLQLVTLNSGTVSGRINWMLETARFLLPALTAYTALQALMQLFHEQTQWLRLWGLHDHVVICGLGSKGSHLASELLALGRRVVIIEKEPHHENAADLRRQGAIILTGDATNGDILASARLHHARHLICLVGEDRYNLQVAFQAYQLTRRRQKGMLTCIIHISSPDLLNLVKSSELSSMEASVPFQLETFNPYARAARLLLQEDPGWQDTTGSKSNVPSDLLVIGLGRLGESLVIQAAYTWYRLQKRGQLCITVLDQKAIEKTAVLLQKHPQLGKVCRIIPLEVDLSSTDQLLGKLKNKRNQTQIQRAYLCLSDPILSQQVCLTLLMIPGLRSIPIRAQMANESELTELLKKPLPGEPELDQVIPFDLYERACSADLVVGGSHELLARELHELYLNGNEDSPADQPSRQPWDQLPEGSKEANRQQANRIHRLLHSAGYRITPLQDWEADKYIFKPEEIDRMASKEHEVWRQTRQEEGWQFGPQKDTKRHLHPDLVAWGELPEPERKKNRVMVRQLPALLAQIGFQIDKG